MTELRPAMEVMYGSHLAAEGIEPFFTNWEKQAHGLGATAILAITASTVIGALREAAEE